MKVEEHFVCQRLSKDFCQTLFIQIKKIITGPLENIRLNEFIALFRNTDYISCLFPVEIIKTLAAETLKKEKKHFWYFLTIIPLGVQIENLMYS